MKNTLALCALSLGIMASLLAPAPSYAASLTDSQVASIIGLLSSFGTDQSVITRVSLSLRGHSTVAFGAAYTYPDAGCLNLADDLYPGAADATSHGEVSVLQKFLGSPVTGTFDSMTQVNLKNWQASHGILYGSYGSEYGFLGSATRAAIAGCAPSSYPASSYGYLPTSHQTYPPSAYAYPSNPAYTAPSTPTYYQASTPSPFGGPSCTLTGSVGTNYAGATGFILVWNTSNATSANLIGPMFLTTQSIGTYPSPSGSAMVTVHGTYTLSVQDATGHAGTCSVTY